VQTNKTKESTVEFMKELKFIAGEKPITEKEFSTARLARTRSYAQQFESYGRVAGQITELWLHGLPLSALQAETDELNKLQLTGVNSVAARYAAPANTSIVLVGDLSQIEAGIRELNLGDVIILDAEGKPVAK
jgi:zinc protease